MAFQLDEESSLAQVNDSAPFIDTIVAGDVTPRASTMIDGTSPSAASPPANTMMDGSSSSAALPCPGVRDVIYHALPHTQEEFPMIWREVAFHNEDGWQEHQMWMVERRRRREQQ